MTLSKSSASAIWCAQVFVHLAVSVCVLCAAGLVCACMCVYVTCSSLGVCVKYDTTDPHTLPSLTDVLFQFAFFFLPPIIPLQYFRLSFFQLFPPSFSHFSSPFPPSTDSSGIQNTVRNRCYCAVSAELSVSDLCCNQNHLTVPRGWCHGGLTFTYAFYYAHTHTKIKCRHVNTYTFHFTHSADEWAGKVFILH